ncbi:hypothetical protein BH23VER1_BH23VER1_02950 [soil metagenome]
MRIPVPTLAVAAALALSHASAQWVEVASFNGGANPFTLAAGTFGIVPDPEDPDNLMLSVGGDGARAFLGLGPNAIPDGGTGTLYFEVFIPSGNLVDLSVGMTDVDAPTGFNQYIGQSAFILDAATDEFRVRDGNGAGAGPFTAVLGAGAEPGIASGERYRVWMVFDLVANVYDVYLVSFLTPEQTLLTTPELGGADGVFTFRRVSDPGALDTILILEGGGAAGNSLVDNFFVNPSAADLSTPEVSEPAPPAPFTVTDIALDPLAGTVSLTWNSQPGLFYSIQRSTDLLATFEFSNALNLMAANFTSTHILPDAPADAHFFRIMESLTPLVVPTVLASTDIYDEDSLQPNTIEKDAFTDDTYTLTQATFEAALATAYPEGLGGIADFEATTRGAVSTNLTLAPQGSGGSFGFQLGEPGTGGQLVTLTMGTLNGFGEAGWEIRGCVSNPQGRTPTSGNYSLNGSSTWDFQIDPADRVTHFAFTLLSREDGGFPNEALIELTLSDGTQTFLPQIPVASSNGGDDTFVGLRSDAPANRFITRVVLSWAAATPFTNLDDLALIVAP